MTDREAIVRLADSVACLAQLVADHGTRSAVLAEREVVLDLIRAMAESAEPAAPTRAFKCTCGGWYFHGYHHKCIPPAAPTKEPGIYTGSPTVTREQADSFVVALDPALKYAGLPIPHDWPAFFRAVADQLDKEE